MRFDSAEHPAILGGTPVRPSGPPSWPQQDSRVTLALQSLIETGDWGRYHGPHVPELCRQLAEYHEREHVLPCSSGTAAVELALRGVGIKADDEVILAGYDFKANFQNILCVGALPVLVDLDPLTWQLNPERIVPAISSRTRAILISHLHGGLVDAVAVKNIAETHGLMVIEDICQNPGARCDGRQVGTSGDVSVLSFGGSKLLTAGRGGAVLTNRTDVAERMKRYQQRGNEAYPLAEMQAAVLRPQLEQLDKFNQVRRDAVSHLQRGLAGVGGLSMLQPPAEKVFPAYYKVGFRYDSECFGGLTREQFIEAVHAEGIALDAGFRGLHRIHATRRFRAADDLTEASLADTGMLTLHHPVLLENPAAIDEIVVAIEKISHWGGEIQRQSEHQGKKTPS